MQKQTLTTTLASIEAHSICSSVKGKLIAAGYKEEDEINLLTILEISGVTDMLWCLCATRQDSNKIALQLAVDFAAEICYPTTEICLHSLIQATRDFNAGLITAKRLQEMRKDVADVYHTSDAIYAAYAIKAAADAALITADVAIHSDTNATIAAVYAANAAIKAVTGTGAKQKMRVRQAEIIRSILQ